MIFNPWRPYPLFKPKKDGWYRCTLVDSALNRRFVMDLYFYADGQDVWEDKCRQAVFFGYKVYKSCREPLEYNRVRTDSLCIRDNVVAWKHLEKPCGRFKMKGE